MNQCFRIVIIGLSLFTFNSNPFGNYFRMCAIAIFFQIGLFQHQVLNIMYSKDHLFS